MTDLSRCWLNLSRHASRSPHTDRPGNAHPYRRHAAPRDLLDEIGKLLGTDQLNKVTMEDDDLHDLYLPRKPPQDAAAFWYHPDRHEVGTRYAGRALVMAHSRDHKRAVSCRIGLEQMEWMFPFEEPTPAPHHLALERMLRPAREAGKKFVETLNTATEAAGGI
jgi:hypothetical protein